MNPGLCAALRTIGYLGLIISIFYAIFLFTANESKMLAIGIIIQSFIVLMVLEAIASILENQELIIKSLNQKK
jgi:hypothetical protein